MWVYRAWIKLNQISNYGQGSFYITMVNCTFWYQRLKSLWSSEIENVYVGSLFCWYHVSYYSHLHHWFLFLWDNETTIRYQHHSIKTIQTLLLTLLLEIRCLLHLPSTIIGVRCLVLSYYLIFMCSYLKISYLGIT